MKMTKRAICLLLAAVMALALTIPVIAAEDTGDSGGSTRTITLDPGAGTLKDGVYEVTATDGKLPALPAPEREGWTFEGWYTGPVTETFDNEALRPGSVEANTHYYQWTISTNGSEVKAGDPFPEVSTLYAKYAPTNVTYKLHASGWRNYFGTLTVTRQYGVPFDPYVFPWNATWNTSDDTVTEIKSWTGENKDTFTLDGWYTALDGGNNITGGIGADGQPNGGTTVGSFGNNVDLYLHWKSETYPEINQTTASTSYRADARASYVEFPQEQRKVVHIHEGESFTLNAYTTPKDAYPLNVEWSSDPAGVVTIEPNEGTTTAKVTGNKYDQDGKEPKTANVTITLTGKGNEKVTRTMTVAVGHDFSSYISSWGGNCKSEGYIQWKCSLPYCSAYYTEHTPATHVLSNPITYPATCTSEGYTIQTCTRCNDYELKTNEVPALGHSFDITTEKGCNGTMTIKTCKVCGFVETVEDPGAGRHVRSSDFEVLQAPTCAADGTEVIRCTECKLVLESQVIPKTDDHSWSNDWTVITPASWDHEGLRERVCTVCGATETEVIDKTPNYPGGLFGGGGSSATPSPSPSASPTPSASPEPSESPSPSPEPGTTPEPGVTPAPSPVPVPVDPPKTNEGSGWSYDYDTGDYYYFVDGEPKANYWAKDETASQWGFWYYVGSDGKLATGLQYIENNNGTGWYFLQPGNADGCVGKMLTGWQWLGPEAGEGWFNTGHGGVNGQCTWTENWGDYDPATGLWEDGLSHK